MGNAENAGLPDGVSADLSDEAFAEAMKDMLAKSEALAKEEASGVSNDGRSRDFRIASLILGIIAVLGLRPISVNLRGRDEDRCWWLEKSVPQGPHESSPVRSAELAFLKRFPSRLVRHSQDAAFALRATARPQREGRATAKRRRDEGGTARSTNAGSR